jgi:Spy/CpxP family protein refolding chaperone
VKQSLITLAILAAFTAAPGAAQQGPGWSSAPRSGQGLLAGITLTTDQQKRVDSIWAAHSAYRQSVQAGRRSGQARDTAWVREQTEVRDRMHRELRAVLTPSQQTVFDQNLARRNRRSPRGAPRGRS